MNRKKSIDSEGSIYSSDIEEVETKEQTHEEEEQKHFPNIYLIKAISRNIETILEDNKNRPNYKEVLKKQSNMVFSSNNIPNISIENYLKRIQTYSNIEKNTLIISLILIDRLCKISNLTLTYHNIHRILFTAILISIKYNEDNFYDNKYYSQIGGVKLKELKILEYYFVNMVNFKFFVDEEIFEKYRLYLDNIGH